MASGQRREWRYAWNAEDQLVRIATPRRGSWTYTYDPLGRWIGKNQRLGERDGQQVAVEETVFVWDGTQLTEQYSALADGSCRTLTWDWEPGTWTPLSQTERARPSAPGARTRQRTRP
ncbi:hypothetical protein KI385_41570 [Streptomyces inhibens]|nr:hypothetical protein KI385_41570 [Streptomyces inhibens]